MVGQHCGNMKVVPCGWRKGEEKKKQWKMGGKGQLNLRNQGDKVTGDNSRMLKIDLCMRNCGVATASRMLWKEHIGGRQAGLSFLPSICLIGKYLPGFHCVENQNPRHLRLNVPSLGLHSYGALGTLPQGLILLLGQVLVIILIPEKCCVTLYMWRFE